MPDHSPPTAQPPVGSPRVERVRGNSTRRAGLVAGLQEQVKQIKFAITHIPAPCRVFLWLALVPGCTHRVELRPHQPAHQNRGTNSCRGVCTAAEIGSKNRLS